MVDETTTDPAAIPDDVQAQLDDLAQLVSDLTMEVGELRAQQAQAPQGAPAGRRARDDRRPTETLDASDPRSWGGEKAVDEDTETPPEPEEVPEEVLPAPPGPRPNPRTATRPPAPVAPAPPKASIAGPARRR